MPTGPHLALQNGNGFALQSSGLLLKYATIPTYTAPTFVAIGAYGYNTSSTTGVNPAIPSGVAVGDLMVCTVFFQRQNFSMGTPPVTPAGWTSLGIEVVDADSNGRLYIFSRVYVAGDAAPNINRSFPSFFGVAYITAFRGVNVSGGHFLAHAEYSGAASGAYQAPAITPVVNGTMALRWVGDYTGVLAPGVPSSGTDIANLRNGSGASLTGVVVTENYLASNTTAIIPAVTWTKSTGAPVGITVLMQGN